MDPTTLRLIQGAAGAAVEATYVDDVYSTYVYEGNGGSQTITNGIDLSGEGGLVWLKNRDAAERHSLQDTERGVNKLLDSSDTIAQVSITSVNSFNSDGFGLNTSNSIFNGSGEDYVSWTFRKAPGFFDVVTWTGDGTDGREIPHSLGSAPGMVIIKRTDSSENWMVYHRSVTTKYGSLNNVADFSATGSGFGGYNMQEVFGNSTSVILPDANNITVARFGPSNASGGTYVAYVFAHDDQSFGTDSDEAIIKCGEYTEGSGVDIDLGFEPQWILLKQYQKHSPGGVDGYWTIIDNMTGMRYGLSSPFLKPNSTDAAGAAHFVDPLPNGFRVKPFWGTTSKSIYVAIRRPNKPPTAGTDVFKATLAAGNVNMTTNFPVDLLFNKSNYTGGTNNYVVDRIRGSRSTLISDNNNAEYTGWSQDAFPLDNNTGVDAPYWGTSGDTWSTHLFRRAPGFLDVVGYTGDGVSGSTKYHNLGVTPELVIIKDRSATYNWFVSSTYLDTFDRHVFLNLTDAQSGAVQWITSVDSTSFRVWRTVDLNTSSNNYVCYLFATLDKISKVGTYSGTGSDLDVDCGFSAGARYILIKRTDSTGDWYVFDHAQGIASGNDGYWLYNTNGTGVTGTDYIDPLNSGFTVTSSAPAGMNASGGTYLFLAIA